MSEPKFNTTDRNDKGFVIGVHAEIPGWKLHAFLDKGTGNVLYPVKILHVRTGTEIKLDAYDSAGCSFPPFVPEELIDQLSECLNTVHGVILAARELIKEEQQRIREDL